MAEKRGMTIVVGIGKIMQYTAESYMRHHQEEAGLVERIEPWCSTDPESVGNWHHERMLRSIQPLLVHRQDTTWMTVGNGRFGSDALSKLSMAWLGSQAGISSQDIASRIGLLGYGAATVIRFKSAPEARPAADLRGAKVYIRNLPRNPCVQRTL